MGPLRLLGTDRNNFNSKKDYNSLDCISLEIISINTFRVHALFFQQQMKNQCTPIFLMFPTGEKMRKVLLSGFEPESKPRKGLMIGRYTTGANFLFKFP
jgi:hypothetical protein